MNMTNPTSEGPTGAQAPCRALIVDDHLVVLQGIRSALQAEPGIEIVGQATGGMEALEQIEALHPDLVIMDISMKGITGLEVTRRLRKMTPDTRVIIFSMHANPEYVVSLCKYGISAYVLKESPLSTLVSAVRAVREGGTYFDAKAQGLIADHLKQNHRRNASRSGLRSLSRREREVFVLLAEGRTIREIAESLHISPKTVETHKYNILEKLNARGVVTLTRMAIREGLIEA